MQISNIFTVYAVFDFGMRQKYYENSEESWVLYQLLKDQDLIGKNPPYKIGTSSTLVWNVFSTDKNYKNDFRVKAFNS